MRSDWQTMRLGLILSELMIRGPVRSGPRAGAALADRAVARRDAAQFSIELISHDDPAFREPRVRRLENEFDR